MIYIINIPKRKKNFMNTNTKKNNHNFSQKNIRYFRKATNTLDPRSKSSSKSKKGFNKELKKEKNVTKIFKYNESF